MLLELVRDLVQPRPDACTYGSILLPTAQVLQTIELPWIPSPDGPAGVPFESCVGVGEYDLEFRVTEKHGPHWQLVAPAIGVYRMKADVPSGAYVRFLVLIHIANLPHELLGCVAPGFGRFVGGRLDEPMVTESARAMNALNSVLGQASHRLRIR